MAKLLDLTGQRYGMLVVLERGSDYISPQGRHVVRWKCKCDCGNTKEIAGSHLRHGDNISCGCYHMKSFLESGEKSRFKATHGMTKEKIYHRFQNMKDRCNNQNAPKYSAYGGRGIKVCDEWMGKDGFEKFLDWSMKNGYRDDLSLDRIDVNGNYEPSNCRWTDWETQHNNTQNSVKLTYKGKTMTATQWGREIGLDRHTIYGRIKKGLPIEEILAPRKRAKCSWMK